MGGIVDADLRRGSFSFINNFLAPRNWRNATIIVVSLSLSLRVLWALVVPMVPISDQVAYITQATTIVEHGVFGWTPDAPSAFWAVGTAGFYAGLFSIFGVSHVPIIIAQTIMGVLLVAVVMVIARRLQGETVSVVVGFLLAVWPSLIIYTTVAASELLFLLLMALATLVWIQDTDWPVRRGILVGLFLGCAALVRPIAMLLPLFFFVSTIFSQDRSQLRQHALAATIAALAMAATIAPWTARNYHVFGAFVPVSANSGTALWMGNNPDSTGGYLPIPERFERFDEVTRDRKLRDEGIAYIKERPLEFALSTIRKAVKLHSRESIAVGWAGEGLNKVGLNTLRLPLLLLANAFFFVVLGLALGGATILRKDLGWRMPFYLPVLVWAYFTGVHAVTVADDRYHLPSIPFIAILAGSFVIFALRRAKILARA